MAHKSRRAQVVSKAARWWRSKRPMAWTEKQHIKQSQVNCVSDAELALAKAVSDYRAGVLRDGPGQPDPRDARIAALEAAMLRACADLVRLVAPDHRPGDMVQRADVVEIAMQLKAAMDERTVG